MAELTYTRVNWKDYPNLTTPINAENLNNIENGIEINKANIDKLSTNGITFEKGEFSVGTDLFGYEFLYAPRSSNLIVESSNEHILALINEDGYLQLPRVAPPTTDNDAATKQYVDNAIGAALTEDY